MTSVLVVSSGETLLDLLRRELPGDQFELTPAQPGSCFVQAARRTRPEVAVLDRIDTRREAALTEIAVLREIREDVRVIAISGTPSAEDALVVEGGIFFYLPASSTARLPEVIRAAAARTGRGGDCSGRRHEAS